MSNPVIAEIIRPVVPAAPASEAPPSAETPAATAPANDLISPKFSILAKKEQAIVRQQQELKQQREQWEKEKQEILGKLKGYEEKDGISKQGAIKLLQAYGYSYEDATKEVMSEGGAEIAAMDRKYNEKLTELEKKIEADKKAQEEAAAKRQEEEQKQIIENFKGELRGFVEQKKDNFKLVALFDKEAELVYDTIDTYFQQHNKILSNQEATDLVEKYFKKMVEEANAALTPAQQAAGEKALEEKRSEPQFSTNKTGKTLTNELQMTTPTTLPAKTENDRMRRALAALEGKS